MITYLSALVSLLSFRVRSRASLELDLRSATSGDRLAAAAAGSRGAVLRRPAALGVAVPNLAAGLEHHNSGQAGNRNSMAPRRLPALLAVVIGITPLGSAQD